MKKPQFLHLTLATVAVLALVALPAQGLTAKAGMDIFVTTGGGQTTVDLDLFPIDQAFGGGATASPTLVSLKGKPIAGLGQTDTVVERFNDVILSAPGDSGTTQIELKGLRLVSESTVAITSQNSVTHWNLEVGLAQRASSSGTMTIQRNNAEGGTFDASFNVYPRLRFSSAGQADVIIDCGVVSCGTMTLSARNASWVSSTGGFDPGAAGVPSIGNGTAFDGDGDGTNDDVFVGGTNYYPGFSPVGPTYDLVPFSHDHPPVAEHAQKANNQCKTRDDAEPVADVESDTTAITTTANAVSSLCPKVVAAEPVPTEV